METIYNTANLRRSSKRLDHSALCLPGFPQKLKVKLSRIIYIQGAGNYVYFHFLDGTKLVVAYTLASYESLTGFLRLHKRHAVNVAYIARLTVSSRTEAWVHLTNGVRLSISRRRIDQVVADLNGQQIVSRHQSVVTSFLVE